MYKYTIRIAVLAILTPLLFTGIVKSQALTNQIEEIIVTAQKTEQNLQDVPIAVSAFDSDAIALKQLDNFMDVQLAMPNVHFARSNFTGANFAIRGVQNLQTGASGSAKVALHVDQIPFGGLRIVEGEFFDIERIEVLRGPQGTLFGQNSTGGTVNVINKMPTFDGFYGKADITLGDYGLKKVRGSFNTPISNNISTRNSFVVTDREGFTDNIVNGQDLDDASHISFRSDWLFELGDTSNFRLFYQYFDADNNGAAMKGLDDQTPNPRKLAQDSMSDYQLSSEIFGAIYEVDLGSVSLKILASSQEDDIYVVRDNDRHNFGDIHAEGPLAGLPYIAAEYRPETSLVETKTFEINLISNEPLFGSIDWILGAFYFDHEIENHIYEVKDVNNVKLVDLMDGKFTPYTHDPICSTNPFAGVCFAAFGAELGFVSDAYPTRESQSVYGQATININDSVRVITGFRYTEDTFSSDVTNFFGLNSYLIEDDLEKTTGRIAIEYDLDDDTMTYLSFTKGFKPGGSNLTFGYPVDDEQNFGANPAPQLVFPIFESETIDAYEIGLKTDLLNSRLRANISAFFYKYENLQFQSTDPDIYRGGVANIPESEMSGLEIEFLGIISNEFSFDLRLSFLETEITSEYEALDNIRAELYFFGEEPIRYTLRESIKGNKLAKSPEFNANFGLMYEKVLSSGKLLKATAEVVHRGDFQQRVFNNPFVDAVDEYTIYNLSLSYEISDKIGLDLIALNISDEDGVNSSMTDVFGVAGTGIELIPPRQFMGRLSYNF